MKKILLATAVLFVATKLIAQPPVIVTRGPRNTINYDAIPDAEISRGIVMIKFKTGYDALLKATISKKTDGSFNFGIPALDALNKQLGVLQLSRIFEKVLEKTSLNAVHKAWGFHRWYSVALPAGTNIKAALKKYQALANIIELAEPSVIRKMDGAANDTRYTQQWHYNHTAQEGATLPAAGRDADIDLPEAWDLETGKPQVIIADIDAGVDTTHPDLLPNLWIGTGTEKYGWNWNSNTALIQPGDHGCHTAGTVAAVRNNNLGVSGIAGGNGTAGSGARIMSMQIFTAGGTYAGDAPTANAFIYSADRGASIAQCSWGGGAESTILKDGIDYFIQNGGGTVMNGGIAIFSAGNNNDAVPSFPAFYPPVLSVASTNYDDKRSWYSSYGSTVDIAAPGGETTDPSFVTQFGGRKGVLSTVRTVARGGIDYDYFQGTSMACPHVSGVAALCISKAMGKLTNDSLRRILLSTTDNIDVLNPGFINQLGVGRLNAFAAVTKAAAIVAPVIDSVVSFTATVNCNSAQLNWVKNAAGNAVIIAYRDTLLFGTPSGTVNINDEIQGGGKIIYKGNGNTFDAGNVPINKKRYFRIWSFNGTNYSFHETKSVQYTTTVGTLVAAQATNCDIQLSWPDATTCATDSFMIITGKKTPWNAPMGILAVGDTVTGGGKVIYKGRATSFLHTSGLDSTNFFQKWNFNASQVYTTASTTIYQSINKINSIATISAVPASTSQINVNWTPAVTDCFNGTQYLLAFSTTGIFGNPEGNYAVGQVISGGGTVILKSSATTAAHTGLDASTDYCYKVWEIKNTTDYSFGKSICTRTPCADTTFIPSVFEGFNGSNLANANVCYWETINNSITANALKTLTTGFTNPTITTFEGIGMLRFNSYTVASLGTARLTTKAVKKGVGKRIDLSFRWYQDSSNYTTATYAAEGVLVQWSNDRLNWQNLEFYPRVPVQGRTGWHIKQLSLPDASLAKDTIYMSLLFTSKFGNNCYLDDLKIFETKFKPTDGITRNAAAESTDSTIMWTHYMDSTGARILSIKKNSNNIGKIGQAGMALLLGGSSGSASITPTGTNYVINNGGWRTTRRYYNLKPVTEPAADCSVRFYFTDADSAALAAAALTLTPPRPNITTADMYVYKINDINIPYDIDPANGHTNVPRATAFNLDGYWEYSRAATASATNWQYTRLGGGMHQAEYNVRHFGGGGIGVGGGGGGALPVRWLNFEAIPAKNKVDLKWVVGEETNVAYYEIQRSTNGTGFENIGRAEATLAAGAVKTYTSLDVIPIQGNNYYRVKQVDKDGNYSFSKTLLVTFKTNWLVNVSPNPARYFVNIRSNETITRVWLVDAAGRQMQTLSGSGNNYRLPVLATGKYYLKIEGQNGQVNQPLIIQ